jgi:hypothetical protein
MKDAYEVLHQKESELTRVRREIASLRIVAPLLSADSSAENSEREEESSEDESAEARAESEGTGTDGFSTFAAVSRPKIWNVLKRGKKD